MPTTDPCVYKTVTLEPGESYSIPSNAEILYISDTTNLSYDCGEFPDTETTCWRFRTPMAGADVDPVDGAFFVTGFQFDNLKIAIAPNFVLYGALGTCVESNNSESPQQFVDRLCYNMWYQLPNVNNGAVILGMTVAYVDADTSGGDIVEIIVHVPDVFTNVVLDLIDTNSQGVNFQVVGKSGDCENPESTDAHRTMGVMAGS